MRSRFFRLSFLTSLFASATTAVVACSAPFQAGTSDGGGVGDQPDGASPPALHEDGGTVVVPPPDGGAHDAGEHDASKHDAGERDAGVDAAEGGEERDAATDATVPENDAGHEAPDASCTTPDPAAVFVSRSSSATSACGPLGTPCGTIAAGLAYAKAIGATHVVLDQGTTGLSYPEQVTVADGVTLEGGWIWGGGSTWTKVCGTGSSTLAVIAPTTASEAVVASGATVTATLLDLGVHNVTVAPTGQSVYGVFATSGAHLTLVNVDVTAASGGDGGSGSPAGSTTTTATCASASDAGTGGPGSSGTAGTNGTYGSSGFTPMTAGSAGTAASGNCGGAGHGGVTATCATYPIDCSDPPSCTCGTEVIDTIGPGNPGSLGTVGMGGTGGGGGSGGGSSIALFAWGATVTITGGSLTSSGGGAGGSGGSGGSGSAGTAGAAGTGPTCTSCGSEGTYPACCKNGTLYATGGAGGSAGGGGGTGGTGGGGAGGDSYAYYAGGGAAVTTSSTTLTPGAPGARGPGGNPGALGRSAAHN